MLKHRVVFLVPAAMALVACPAPDDGPEVGEPEASDSEDEDDGNDTEPQVDPTAGSMTTAPPPTSDTEPETDTEPPPPETESDTCNFICDPDTPMGECSLWDQDCPDGEKCAPWANDGGNSWNSSKCVQVEPDPGQPGDPCTTEGGGVSGLDSCDVSSMCWDVQPETGEGVCVALCDGSENNPVCDNPSTTCIIANDGFLPLCLPDCDPLLQDCPDGQACYAGDESFVCVPDASGPDLGSFGDPCEYTNACDAGLLCAGAAAVPGCTSARCCTEFCDLAEADPDASCQGQGDGQMCIGIFEDGQAPPGAEDYGFCSIPG